MAYEKQTFVDQGVDESGNPVEGTVLKAEHLNHIEEGIVAVEKVTKQANTTANSAVFMAMFTKPGALLWDGDRAGHKTVDLGGYYLVHVSDEIQTIESESAVLQICVGGLPVDASETDVMPATDKVTFVGEGCAIVAEDNVDLEGLVFPKAGVYFLDHPEMYTVTGLLIPGYNFQGDMLAGEMETGGDTLEWDGNTEGLVSVEDVYYKVSDVVITADMGIESMTTEVSTGEIYSNTPNFSMVPGVGIGSAVIYVSTDNTTVGEATFIEKGIYFSINNGVFTKRITIPGYTGFPIVKKLDEQYLPDTVVKDGDTEFILASSTEGSTKKFKVTVDDTGTLTTTEVTE